MSVGERLVGERRKAAARGSAYRDDQSESAVRRELAPASWIAAPVTADPGRTDAETSGAPGGLVVGDAADPEEARAERVADSVMHALRRQSGGATWSDDATPGGTPVAAIRRSTSPMTAEPAVGRDGGALEPGLSGEIASHVGGGSPIPAALRRSMEGAFGRDLGGVRLHTDAPAAQLSRQVSARAFTLGRDVFFGDGEYRPDTPDGQHMLAHELAHTAAGGGAVHRVFGIGERKKTDAEKQASEQNKATKKQNKQAVKDSKAAVTAEDERLKQERKIGKASRAATAAAVAGDRETTTQTLSFKDENGDDQKQIFTGVEVQSDTALKDIADRFIDHRDREAKMRTQIVEAHLMSEEEAAKWAYEKVWTESKDAEVRAHRPPRETAAERLVSEVKQYRNAAGVREGAVAGAQRGRLLPKAMEEIYERFVVVYDRELKNNRSEDEAELAAEVVWATAKLKGLPPRPKPGSPVDKQAREDARRRVVVMGPPKDDTKQDAKDAKNAKKKKPGKGAKALDAASSAGEKIQSGFEAVAPVLSGVGAIANAAGLGGSVDMRNADSVAAGIKGNAYGEIKSGNTAPGNEATELFADFGGADVQAIMQADAQVKLGVQQVDYGALSSSTSTLVGQGFNAVTEMLGGLISGANGALVFVKSVQKAHTTGDPKHIAAAAKEGADALASFSGSAKSAANLSAVINPGVATAVQHVVPGLDIAAAALGIISGAMSMVVTGMRVQSTQLALNSAHQAMSGKKPNVLIYPLLRVEQSYVKAMEQNTWTTVKAVSDLAASIAQIASAGGYGVPAAYKAATNLLDVLHSIGHMIADDVLARLAKKAQKHSVAVLEGSAEERLQRDPAMAVDGIIVSAVKGDPIAQEFLNSFTLGTERVDSKMLKKLKPDAAEPGNEALFLQIRAELLDSMGNDAEPLYHYEKFAKSASSIVGSAKKHTTDKYAKISDLAEGRNKQDELNGAEGDRGLGWRMKMMFTREHQLDRKVNTLRAHERFGVDAGLTEGMVCRCGQAQLPKDATPAQEERFKDAVNGASTAVLKTAAVDPLNPPRWQQFFLKEVTKRELRLDEFKKTGKVLAS